jgi:hypothetical protein
LACVRLSPSCPFRLLHTYPLPRPARHYPRVRIQCSSFEHRRDFNPPEQCAAQRTLFRCPTPRRCARGSYGYRLHPPACCDDSLQASPRSPGSRVWSFPTCMGSLTTQGRPATRAGAADRVAFRSGDGVGALIANFRSSIPSPSFPLFTLHWTLHSAQRKTRGRVDRYSFLVRLFHPQLHTGLSRRTTTFFPATA